MTEESTPEGAGGKIHFLKDGEIVKTFRISHSCRDVGTSADEVDNRSNLSIVVYTRPGCAGDPTKVPPGKSTKGDWVSFRSGHASA